MAIKKTNKELLTKIFTVTENHYAKKSVVEALKTKVETLVSTGGEPNVLEGVKVNGTALAIAEKMVNILISAGTTNGTISFAGADIAVKGLAAMAYKANVSQDDLDAALKTVIAGKAESGDLTALAVRMGAAETSLSTLIGTTEGDGAKSVRTISAEEVAKIVAGADESYDTLKEIADWISGHASDATSMNTNIRTNAENITKLTALIGALPDDALSSNVVDYIAERISGLITESGTGNVITSLSYDSVTGKWTAAKGISALTEDDFEEFTDEEIAAAFAEAELAAAAE